MNSLFRSFIKGCDAKHNLGPGLKLAVLMCLCAPSLAIADWYSDARALMGTEVSVYLWSDDAKIGPALLEEVFQEAVRIDLLMSTYKDDSEISKINRDAGLASVHLGEELHQLIAQSLEISQLTNGAFDITYDSVGQHFDFRQQQRPDQKTIAAEIENIDFRHIVLDENPKSIRFKKQGVRINLGGIAKGYLVERGVDILRQNGIRHGIVTAGGDSRLLGNRRGRPWMVGIRDPRDEGEVAISVPLEDEAISTSGDYERFFDEGGVRYHHIIQPATGAPASGVRSATVFGPDAVLTDALSTSVFVLGVDKGLRLIATLSNYESIVIDATGQVFYSDGLQQPAKSALEK